MSGTERLSRYRVLLSCRRALSASELTSRLEISPATLKRDLKRLRDQHGMPIRYDRDRGGYVLDAGEASLELPGLWFRPDEIHALLAMRHLLASIEPGGLLAGHLEPLRAKLESALSAGGHRAQVLARRVRVLSLGARQLEPEHFMTIGHALLERRRVEIVYFQRSRSGRNRREISPQRLVHYRDNWYLDAWCHWREALRTFSLDAIESAQQLDRQAIDIPDDELDAILGAGYGIFSGAAVQWATLRFSPERSRWVSSERWHSEQRGQWDDDGRWVLTVPYSDPRELVMDILRHVPEVEVLAPGDLRDEVFSRLRRGFQQHEKLRGTARKVRK